MPTRRSARYCYFSQWHLIKSNPVSGDRRYGVFIYNACASDRQVFPTPADPRFGSCNNDDTHHASAQYSLCPVLQSHHVPAGLAPHECDALSVASTSLSATVTPPTYDPRTPTLLTATTTFATNIAERLSDGTCLANLDWRDTAWSMRWSDGATDSRPGSGKQGITDAHLVAPHPTGPATTSAADVTAVASLHLTGDAVDFDDAGSPTIVHRQADVQLSNHGTSAAILPGAAYTPPQLTVAAVPVGQRGDGTIPPPDPRQPPLTHADTIRGRLLELFPRVLVVRPGTETVAGAPAGNGRTEVVSWTYAGPPTDAPAREATTPGQTGPPDLPVTVQWNHAERLDGQRRPVDEQVPLILTVRTTYPDGHAEEQQVTGAIAVSIYYVGLMDVG
ncbi:MAG TPA: hypothetical protein VMU20_21875 [Candidatus Dormibacteraeota bacterium]|nr:hypothetical protein [Candidatus Dormibacteraeota bacterium]